MKGFLYINNEKIGEVDFKIIDESMGAIGGQLIAVDNYLKYKRTIQENCARKGISNIDDFNYKIFDLYNVELKPAGGIGITDVKDFEEIFVKCAGLNQSIIKKIKTKE